MQRLRQRVEEFFEEQCVNAGRHGVIGFSSLRAVRLLPEQREYLEQRLQPLKHTETITAVSLGILYHPHEISVVPSMWKATASADDAWSGYLEAYDTLNALLNHIAMDLAARFGGIAEKATLDGWVETVSHYSDYYPHCASHRAFAEAAGLGWRGRHGLIVTPQAGPALRFATVFVPYHILGAHRELPGCGQCRACLEVCPILGQSKDYLEGCRRRLAALRQAGTTCGICVRVCRDRVIDQSPAATAC